MRVKKRYVAIGIIVSFILICVIGVKYITSEAGRDKLKYALSNKLYYAAMLGKPILVSPDTCMEKVTQQYEFGFSCDENDENLADKIYEYYTSVEWDEFYNKCDSFIYDVTENEKVMKSEFQALQK